ncbi:MAG: DUF4268 domain-containing protein [Leptolyngbya sp.]|nr:MAG: DUF4268 domain-containing protein [Leptolyngbya sp.]
MASIVQHLIPESQTPETLVTATEDMPIQDALERMTEYDFSQLPVVDKEFRLKGLITSDSILQAVSYFKSTLDKIKVSHATLNAKACRPDDDLSELLNGLRDASAIPIVDKTRKLLAIVTNYDTAEYYRQRAEDIMLAEDIETTLRDYIESAYRNDSGDIDDDALRKAIEGITSSGKDLKNKFTKALCDYLSRSKSIPPQPKNQLIDDVFIQHLHKIEIKAFEDLTLSDFIQLFKNLWQKKYSTAFNNLGWDAIYKLLDEVRQTRNAIAHFREVTPTQRKQLKFCASLLERHRPIQDVHIPNSTVVEIAPAEPVTIIETDSGKQPVANPETNFVPTDEELGPDESRYASLALWLQGQVETEVNKCVLTFEKVENIIEDKLPPSARQHRSWWANTTVGHTQSQQWLEAGWRVSNVNISEERVVFSRINDRQSAYINFFNQLLPKLEAVQSFSVTSAMNAQGRHWFTVVLISEKVKEPICISFSFARRSRFRVELYIETGDRDTNKRLFDKLYSQKAEIEADLGEPLQWERLDSKRASRIALYHEEISITQSPEELIPLQEWAVEMTSHFYRAISQRFQDANRAVMTAS